MADAPRAEIPIVRIAQEIPTVFVDGIASQSFGFGVVKMYVSRFDPDPSVLGPTKETIVMQLVMPVDNFVRTVAFLEQRLVSMVQAGAITQGLVDESRQYWRDQSNA